jgi:hypothetical protein
VVTHDGGTYQARCDTARTPGHADWVCLAKPGTSGKDGKDARPFRVRGTYDVELCGAKTGVDTYKALDIVTLNRSWFISKSDNPGPCPGPDWQAGPAGTRGERGERGMRGERGEAGPAGVHVLAFEVDPSTYALKTVMSDGEPGPGVSLRPLFERFAGDYVRGG